MLGYQSSFDSIPRYLYTDDERMDKPIILSPATVRETRFGRQIVVATAGNRAANFTPKLPKHQYSHPDHLGRDCNAMYRLIMHNDEQPLYKARKRKVLNAIRLISKKQYRLAKSALRNIYDVDFGKWRILKRFDLLEYEYFARLEEIILMVQNMHLPPVIA